VRWQLPLIRLLWLSVGLATLGFVLIWLGTVTSPIWLWLGLAAFVVAMLLGPASRYLAEG
jgi:hypothetical protein